MDVQGQLRRMMPDSPESPCPLCPLWLAFVLSLALGFAPAWAAEPPKTFTHGVVIRFEGEITRGLHRYLERKLEVARDEGADLIILEIDSPGGLLDSSLEIAKTMQKLPWAHTVAYVPEKALSGAAIAALGCDEILMAPRAKLGDAGPIFMGRDALFHHAPEKIVSFLAVEMRDLAEAKGRPPALAEAMVDRDLTVLHVEDVKTGKTTYISEREFDKDPKLWKKIGTVAESGRNRFLTVVGDDAVRLGLAEATIGSREELAPRYGLKQLHVIEPGGVDTTVEILNSFLVTGLLVVIGLIGLYVEFTAPGTIFGGLVAAVAFSLLFWSHFLGGTAGWLQMVLFLLGLVFLAVELFVLPGSFVAGIGGLAFILISLIMTTQGFLVPQTQGEVETLATTLVMILCSGIAFVIAAVLITRNMGSLPVFHRLTLAPPEPDAGQAGATSGPQIQVGDVGTASSALRPGGKVQFGDRLVDALTDGDFIPRGSRVEVVRVSGNQIVVAEAPQA